MLPGYLHWMMEGYLVVVVALHQHSHLPGGGGGGVSGDSLRLFMYSYIGNKQHRIIFIEVPKTSVGAYLVSGGGKR